MSVTTEQIKPETIALIERQAETVGLTIDDFLQSLLLKSDAGFEADMSEFAEAETEIYQGNYSREDIYFDHD
jgi:hypothetical protein